MPKPTSRAAALLLAGLLGIGTVHAFAQDELDAPDEETLEQLQDPQGDPDANNNKAPAVKGKDVRVANPVAEFAGLDKITGRITSFDVYVNETVQFGALQVTPRICYARPDAEEPKTDSSSKSTKLHWTARSGASSPVGCSPRAPASTRSSTPSMTCG